MCASHDIRQAPGSWRPAADFPENSRCPLFSYYMAMVGQRDIPYLT